jgi:hypothetical protein
VPDSTPQGPISLPQPKKKKGYVGISLSHTTAAALVFGEGPGWRPWFSAPLMLISKFKFQNT